MLLAIDTATATASVSLYDGSVVAECTWQAGQDHTRQLLPRVHLLLEMTGRSTRELTAVGVSLGPGSYNGLRVGLATAKAICFSLGIPIIGIETLRVTAYAFRLTGRPIRPLYHAGMGEVATGLYRARGEVFATLEEPHLTALADALAMSPPDTVFCGELRPEWCQLIAERFGGESVLVRPAEGVRRAGYLAELAWQQLQAGRVDDAVTLQPLYLRRPQITAARPRSTGGQR